MAYQVLHMQKIKVTALGGIQSHNRREHESKTNPDIDGSRQHLNMELPNLSTGKTFNRSFKERLQAVGYDKKLRENIVGCGSFLVSASKEFFAEKNTDEIRTYFSDVANFLDEKYGHENVLYAHVHMDEATPHMHYGIVPITADGRLSAKEVFSPKNGFTKLQADLNEYLQQKGYDLEKGEKNDQTKHLEPMQLKERALQEEIEKLEDQKQTVAEEVSELNKQLETYKPVDAIPVKEKQGLFRSKTVEIDAEDWESVKVLAKASKRLIEQNKRFERDIDRLEHVNSGLMDKNRAFKHENEDLKAENKFLRETLERLKQVCKKEFPKIAIYIGYAKSIVQDFSRGIKATFREDEIAGIEVYKEVKRESQEQIEREKAMKPKRSRGYEMER